MMAYHISGIRFKNGSRWGNTLFGDNDDCGCGGSGGGCYNADEWTNGDDGDGDGGNDDDDDHG